MKEKGKLDIDRNRQLRFEILKLLVFGCEEESIVVETNLAEGDGIARLFGGKGQFLEGGEEEGRATGVCVEVFCRAWMNTYGCIAETSWSESEDFFDLACTTRHCGLIVMMIAFL